MSATFIIDTKIIKNNTGYSIEDLNNIVVLENLFIGLNGRATFSIDENEVNCIWKLNGNLIELEFNNEI